MKKAIKKKGKFAQAYELGSGSAREAELIQAGKIRALDGGRYELFSRESASGSGEIAQVGDFFKVDGGGYPYPLSREFFLANHRHVEGDLYEQPPKPLNAWQAGDAMCPEIEFLIGQKGLVINPSAPEKYFSAPLWGTIESAAQDAVIIFYSIDRDGARNIVDADFNFVERSEFEATYEWVEQP